MIVCGSCGVSLTDRGHKSHCEFYKEILMTESKPVEINPTAIAQAQYLIHIQEMDKAKAQVRIAKRHTSYYKREYMEQLKKNQKLEQELFEIRG